MKKELPSLSIYKQATGKIPEEVSCNLKKGDF